MAPDQVPQPYFTPNIDVVVSDYTLDLSEIDKFSKNYGPRTGGEVHIVSRWGAPAAGGLGWGGPEIAVAIVLGEMLRRASSDAYAMVRSFISDVYSRIRTRSGARLYLEGAMAIGIDSETKPLRLLFCFPEGLTPSDLEARLRLVERHWADVLAQFEEISPAAAAHEQHRDEVKLCWDLEQQRWSECEPPPHEQER